MAAKRYGLDDLDEEVLNKIVNLVNQGETVDSAAKKVAGKK
jgi:predicted transcriptional regulator